MTPVTRNASGSRIERSTCDSAAKLTIASVSATSGPTTVRVGDVAADEPEPGRLLRVGPDGRQVRLVAGVGELVEDRDPRAVAPGEHVAHEARADEAGAARDEQVGAGAESSASAAHVVTRSLGRASMRAAPSRPGRRRRRRGDLGRPEERRDGAGVGPVAVVDAREEPAVRDVVVEHVGDLELAAARRREVLDDVERVGAQEVDADRDQVALRLRPASPRSRRPARRRRARRRRTAPGPARGRAACRRPTGPASNSRATSARAGPRRMLSPRTQQNASLPTKSRARPIAWAMPERAALVAVRQVEPEVPPVAEQLDDVADALAADDDHHLADAHRRERLDRVVDHRPVVDRQQVLVGDDREREQPRRGPAGKDDALHRRSA